jgi:membrane-bound lytic murein transglycosylase D
MTLRGGVVALASACLLLGACATVPGARHSGPATEAPSQQPAPGEQTPATAATPPAEVAAPAAPPEPPLPPPDIWQRLARGLGFARCDDAAVARLIQAYATNPEAFRLMMGRALPGLEYVLAEVERRGLPTEFALLPLVESGYRPGPSRKGGVAGIWQLMPATAREHGLRMDREYDGRLDLAASTDAALSLVAALHDQFPQDWRLVDMAYNAGHYRIAMAMAVRERRGLEVRAEQLDVSPTTHAHVAKVQALACLVRDAPQHELELPAVDPEATLVAVPASGGLDFELASRLSRIDIGRLYELNPGYLRRRVPRAGAHVLVLPQSTRSAWSRRWRGFRLRSRRRSGTRAFRGRRSGRRSHRARGSRATCSQP